MPQARESVPAGAKWQYDYVEHYNLDADIINKYLKEIWGNYKYFTEVNHTIIRRKNKDLPEIVCLIPHSAQVITSDSGSHGSSTR